MDLKGLASEGLINGKTLDERIKFYKEPCVSIAVVENGEIATLCKGNLDRKLNQRVNAETMFQASSISKSFFVATVMKLVKKDILNLDCDIREYGEYEFYDTYDNKYHRVTIRQLLSHTGGFDLGGFAGYIINQRIPTLNQILRGQEPANNIPLVQKSEPGIEFSYSGGGYMLAQKIVEDITKKSVSDIISEEILLPFGLKHSTFQNPSDNRADNYAKGIDMFNQYIEGGYCIMPETAAAGLWTTPTDLCKFGIELMKAYYGKSNVFGQDCINEMLKPGLPGVNYGLGISISQDDDKDISFGHYGSNWGYRSTMNFRIKSGRGFVVMLNSEIADSLIGEIAAVIREKINN